MDPVALAALLQSAGPYGIAAILCGVVAKLWTDLISERKAHIQTLTDWREDTASSNDKLYGALDTVKALMQQGGRVK